MKYPEELLKQTNISYKGYLVYRNREGYLELYKKLKSEPDLRRIVTPYKTEEELRIGMKKNGVRNTTRMTTRTN